MSWIHHQAWHRHRFRKRGRSLSDQAMESYLREDVPCGYPKCNACKSTLPRLPTAASHIVIPDSTVVRDYLEVFQLPELQGVVYLTSCVKQVMAKGNLRKGTKIRQLYSDVRRQCVLFDDSHCIWTAGPPAESSSNMQLMRAANYYFQHLDQKVPVVVVSDAEATQHAVSNGTSATSTKSAAVQRPDRHTAPAPAAAEYADDELDKLLNSEGLDSFDLQACKPEQPHMHLQTQQIQQGVQVLTSAQYFAQHWSHVPVVSDLYDSIHQSRQAASTEKGANRASGAYKAHLSAHTVERELNSGTVLQGVLHMSKRSTEEGSVHVGRQGSALLGQIHVKGNNALNRALHGDVVAVQMLPQSEWQAAPPDAAQDDDVDESDSEDPEADAAAATSDSTAQSGHASTPQHPTTTSLNGAETTLQQPEVHETASKMSTRSDKQHQDLENKGLHLMPVGEVVAIMQRSNQEIVVSMAEEDQKALQSRQLSTKSEAVICVPSDRRVPKVRVRSSQVGRLVGQRFVVRCTGWEPASMYPSAHVVRVLGPLNDLRAETDAVLVNAGVHWQPFSDLALAELPQVADPAAWHLPEEEASLRRDLRSTEYFICSIDPPGCTDVDDALSARRLPNGQIEVGVHIADVSHFVQKGGFLDGEAYARGTTVYLQDRRLDMLPSLLSEHLCSLRAGADRCAVSVLWTLHADWTVDSVWFGRSVIRSQYQLTYQQAQDMLDGKPPSTGPRDMPVKDHAELQSRLSIVKQLTDKLRAARVENGALELEVGELSFETGPGGKPRKVEGKTHLPMMSVVAEMMILANAAVAHRIAGTFPGAALLRRHAPPRPDGFEQVRELCAAAGVSLDVSSNRALAASLEAACSASPQAAALIRSLTTRAMSEAEYCSTGDIRPGGGGVSHFGLALEEYTHFTSPIRRYADVVVHRQLLQAVKSQPNRTMEPAPEADEPRTPEPLMSHAELASAADIMNERHRASKRAQKECSDLYLLLLLHSQPHVEAAVVYAIKPTSLLVFVPKLHLKGSVHLIDRAGLVRLPVTAPGQDSDDPFSVGRRRQYRLESGESSVSIVHMTSDEELFKAHTMDNIWVELAANSSAAHGPTLRIRLASAQHPAVQAASIKAAYTPKADWHEETTSIGSPLLSSRQPAHQLSEVSGSRHQKPQAYDDLGIADKKAASGKQMLSGIMKHEGTVQDVLGQKPDFLRLEKPKLDRKAKKAEPELKSITAVLNAMDLSMCHDSTQTAGMIPATEQGTSDEAGQHPVQLVSCSACPCVELVTSADRRTSLQAFWQLQLQHSKMSARADRALCFASSDRMARLQTKMNDLSLEMRHVRKQLQVI